MTENATTESLNTKYAALLAVLDNAADAIISMDASGVVLTFNPAAERMFQYDADDIIGRDISRLMPAPTGARHDDYVGNYLRTGERKIIGTGRDVLCQRRDGTTFTANLSVSESVSKGQALFTGILRDLTEQNAIRDRVASLGGILENSLSAIYVIEPDALCLAYANQAAWQAWGDAVDGSTRFRLSELFDSDSCERFVAAIERFTAGTGKTSDFKARAIRHDGVRYSVQVHLFAGRFAGKPVAIASVLDISEQQRIEAALDRKRLEQQLILRFAPIGIALMDEKGRLQSVNKAALRICGYDEATLLGRLGLRFMHTDDQLEMRQLFGRLVAGELGYSSSTHQLRHADGHYVPIRTYNAAIHDTTLNRGRLICMFEDLSEQHARDSELQLQRERLAHASRLTQLGEMAAGLAHELNQPLAAIQTYASAGKRLIGVDAENHDELVTACERISQQSQRAADVIRKIRTLTTRQESSRELSSINTVISDLMTLVEIDLRHSAASIQLDLDEDLTVYADNVQIEQVLLNFIRNAIDAVHGMAAERQRIVLRARQHGDEIRVEVIDRGSGVSDAQIPTLFDPFVSSKPHGMGMGLSISKSIIEAHDGRIGYTDNSPQGAVFWFTLPAADNSIRKAQ